jgi:adenylate kinase
MPKYIVLVGAPGCGKGTQCEKLLNTFTCAHIATGDIFRYHIRNKTELGLKVKQYTDNGKLVPDELTVDMVKTELLKHTDKELVLLDGFPRTINQAQLLDAQLKIKNEKINACI